DAMTELVVDRLETVQVEKQQGDRAALPAAQLQGQIRACRKQGAVGQAGQGVVMGQPLDALLIAQALGDVAGQYHIADRRTQAQRRDRQLEAAWLPLQLQVHLPAGADASVE